MYKKSSFATTVLAGILMTALYDIATYGKRYFLRNKKVNRKGKKVLTERG
ncbi:hypothetical protein [Aminipila luticellarii]|nr:hypothetical protein [Aminipila luticellarii]